MFLNFSKHMYTYMYMHMCPRSRMVSWCEGKYFLGGARDLGLVLMICLLAAARSLVQGLTGTVRTELKLGYIHTYMYQHMHVHMYVCAYIYIYIPICEHVRVNTYHIYICIYKHVCIYIYEHVCTYTYVNICVYRYVFVYTHVYR